LIGPGWCARSKREVLGEAAMSEVGRGSVVLLGMKKESTNEILLFKRCNNRRGETDGGEKQLEGDLKLKSFFEMMSKKKKSCGQVLPPDDFRFWGTKKQSGR
jgi:hypothetical protein